MSDEEPPQFIEDLMREVGAMSGRTPEETDERIRAIREAWKTFSKPEVQEQVSQAGYRGAGFVIYDKQGYDIQLAKDSVGPGWASLIDKVFDAKPPDLRIVQVKEKYAGLRIYTDRIDKQFDDLLFDRAGPPKSRRFIGLAGNAATCLYDTDDERPSRRSAGTSSSLWCGGTSRTSCGRTSPASVGLDLEHARRPMNEIGPFKQLPKGEG